MVNSEDFIERLEEILRYYDLSASGFADRIKVQRSSISHLLSGRNKPSLEFVMKLVDTFPEVDLYWILKGEGRFPASKKSSIKVAAPAPKVVVPASASVVPDEKVEVPTPMAEEAIDRIVIFYKDGTFKSYQG